MASQGWLQFRPLCSDIVAISVSIVIWNYCSQSKPAGHGVGSLSRTRTLFFQTSNPAGDFADDFLLRWERKLLQSAADVWPHYPTGFLLLVIKLDSVFWTDYEGRRNRFSAITDALELTGGMRKLCLTGLSPSGALIGHHMQQLGQSCSDLCGPVCHHRRRNKSTVWKRNHTHINRREDPGLQVTGSCFMTRVLRHVRSFLVLSRTSFCSRVLTQ